MIAAAPKPPAKNYAQTCGHGRNEPSAAPTSTVTS
jgi:hypothetical protein